MEFTELTLEQQIEYASWVACIGNEVLEMLHAARRSLTDGERAAWQQKALEKLQEYETATIAKWIESLQS